MKDIGDRVSGGLNIGDILDDAPIWEPPSSAVSEPQSFLDCVRQIPDHWLDPEMPPPEREMLLHRFPGGSVPRGEVCMLSAEGGTGKTHALIQAAVAVASGTPWLGCYKPVEAGGVLLMLGEEDDGETWRRVRRAAAKAGLFGQDSVAELAALKSNLHVAPLKGIPTALTEQLTKNAEIRETAHTRQILEYAERVENLALVVIDPLSRFAGPGVEVDNHAATRFVQVLERIVKSPSKPSVLLATHVAKAASAAERMQFRFPRGASALYDAARWVGALARDETPGFVKFGVLKSNYTGAGEDMLLCQDASGGLSHG